MSTDRTARLAQRMERLGACAAAVAWVVEEQFETAQRAWDACFMPDWMFWVAEYYAPSNNVRREVAGIEITFAEHRNSLRDYWSKRDVCDAIRLVMPKPPGTRKMPKPDDDPPF